MEKLEFTFNGEPQRLDSFLSEETELTRSALQKLIDNGQVTVNGNQPGKSYKLKNGDKIILLLPDPEPLDLKAEDIPLEIMYEDEHLIVVNKPKDMVVHPAPGNYSGTLVNALLYHCRDSLSGINGVMRPGIVHRIDKDTSGLLMVAKNDAAHIFLADQIKNHSFTREYEAVVMGRVKNESGVVELPIGRHPVKRKQMAVTYSNSRYAKTEYRVLSSTEQMTHLRLKLFTGRTHQIRVHMAAIGHPVAGDLIYGRAGSGFKKLGGQCLHAKKLGFIHPVSREYMEFESDLPQYFANFLKEHKLNGNI